MLGGDGVPAQALGADRPPRRPDAGRHGASRGRGPRPSRRRLDVAARVGAIAGPTRARIDAGELATLEVLGAAATSPVDLAWALMRPDAFIDAPPRPVFSVRPLSLAGAGAASGLAA